MANSAAEIESLVRFLVTSLVDAPDAVEISVSEEGQTVTLEIGMETEDIGKVIGRQGRVIKAIRTVARAAGSQSGLHVEVEVLG